MLDATFGGALLLGLMGSAHCVGMCGGIAATLGGGGGSRGRLFSVCYHLGRIGCYAVIGAVAGAAVALFSASVSSPLPTAGPHLPTLGLWLRTIAGLLVIAMGLYISGWWRGIARLEALGGALWKMIQPGAKKLFPPRNAVAALKLGAAWGLLPCGLIYSSLAWAATSADPLRSAALMATFGIGTLPAMLATSFAGHALQQRLQRRWVRHLAGALLIVFGIYSIALPWAHALVAPEVAACH